MLDYLWTILEGTVEYQNFGANAQTLSSAGTVFFTLLIVSGALKQVKEIWTPPQSAEGVSVLWLVCEVSFFATALPYGVHQSSLTITFNSSLLCASHLPIVIGLWCFKSWARYEKVWAPLFLALPLVFVLVPWKEAFFLAVSFGTIGSTALQPYEIVRDKCLGRLSPWFIAGHLSSTIFWTVYAFSIGAVALQIMNPIMAMIFIVTLVLCAVYRDREAQPI